MATYCRVDSGTDGGDRDPASRTNPWDAAQTTGERWFGLDQSGGRVMGKTLRALGLADLPCEGPAPNADAPVAGLCVDSRKTEAGFVFFAIKGEAMDGAEFAQFAIRMGAIAVVCSAEGVRTARETIGEFPVPFIIVDDPRTTLAFAAAAFFDAQPRTVVAITGTNGKTSVASFLRQIYTALGRTAASFGTVGVEGAVEKPLSHTTPEPITLHGLLAELADAGVTHATMELSLIHI